MTTLCDLAIKYRTDKSPQIRHSYTPYYDALLSNRPIKRILEIGIGYPENMTHVEGYKTGASLRMWEEYFPEAQIYGLDNNPDALINEGRIKSFYCDQGDTGSLQKVVAKLGEKFDLIIDDGSHRAAHQILSAVTLIPQLLKPDGLYIIEDVLNPKDVTPYISQYPFEIKKFNKFVDDTLIVIQNKERIPATPEESMKQAVTTKYRLMVEEGLQWLAEQSRNRYLIVNVGSWTGASVRALANSTRGVVISIDPWILTKEECRSWRWPENDLEFLYKTYQESVVTFPNVVSIRSTSEAMVNIFYNKGFRFDMVFIDANHLYEPVKFDITAWRNLVCPGGLLCGHDYRDPEPGVKQAVDELVPNRKLGPDTIWYSIL